jgi:hypothetical protein
MFPSAREYLPQHRIPVSTADEHPEERDTTDVDHDVASSPDSGVRVPFTWREARQGDVVRTMSFSAL